MKAARHRRAGQAAGTTFHVGELGRGYYTHIYAIGVAGGGPIKFGRAKDVQHRFGMLQVGSPVKLEIIGFAFAPYEVEWHIHSHLRPDHSHGEWFFDGPEPRLLAQLLRDGAVLNLAARVGAFELVPAHVREAALAAEFRGETAFGLPPLPAAYWEGPKAQRAPQSIEEMIGYIPPRDTAAD